LTNKSTASDPPTGIRNTELKKIFPFVLSQGQKSFGIETIGVAWSGYWPPARHIGVRIAGYDPRPASCGASGMPSSALVNLPSKEL